MIQDARQKRRATFFMFFLAAVFVISSTAAGGGLAALRAQGQARTLETAIAAQRKAAAPAAAKPAPACAYPSGLNEAGLKAQVETAAQAVGLQVRELEVRKQASPGDVTLTLAMQARGGYEPIIGFLRLALVANPDLEPALLRLDAEGQGALILTLTASATCRA